MPKKKGDPKTGGRKAGTPNKRTVQMNAFLDKLTEYIENQFVDNPDIMQEMSYKQQLEFYRDFIQYFKPKMATLKVEEESKQEITINIKNAG
jgi:hemerythrin